MNGWNRCEAMGENMDLHPVTWSAPESTQQTPSASTTWQSSGSPAFFYHLNARLAPFWTPAYLCFWYPRGASWTYCFIYLIRVWGEYLQGFLQFSISGGVPWSVSSQKMTSFHGKSGCPWLVQCGDTKWKSLKLKKELQSFNKDNETETSSIIV